MPDANELKIMGLTENDTPSVYKAHQGGCDFCAGQGYKGRVAVAEILYFDEDMDEVLAKGASKADLKTLAKEKGFKSMKDDGILKVLEGLTSIEALARTVDVYK